MKKKSIQWLRKNGPIVAILILVGAAWLQVSYETQEQVADTDSETDMHGTSAVDVVYPDEPPTEQSYQEDVERIMATFSLSQDAQTAHEALLDVWVPTTYKDAHVALVLAFEDYAQGDTVEGDMHYQSAKQYADWLP